MSLLKNPCWLFLPGVGPLVYLFSPKNRFNVGCFLLSTTLFAYLTFSQGLYYLWYVLPFFMEEVAKLAYAAHNAWMVALYLFLFNAALTQGESMGRWRILKPFFAPNVLTNALVSQSGDSNGNNKGLVGRDFSQYLSR